jgi:hypothetical protein
MEVSMVKAMIGTIRAERRQPDRFVRPRRPLDEPRPEEQRGVAQDIGGQHERAREWALSAVRAGRPGSDTSSAAV